MPRRWLPAKIHVTAPYVSGPKIDAALTAKPQSQKNSANRVGGARYPTTARPAACDEPMHRPARLAAIQKLKLECEKPAIRTITIQPTSVSASERTCPIASCR